MTQHRPKTAALIAYASGLLSPEGRGRVDRHLAGCEVCREELAAIQAYDSLIEDVQSSELPELDFQSMELTLSREAEAISRQMVARQKRRSLMPYYAAIALAAAVGLAIWAWPRLQPDEAPVAETETVEEAAEPETSAPVVEESPRLEPVVTLAAGEARRVDGEEPVDLAVGDALDEGAALATGDDGELHVRLSDGTGVRLASGTELSLARTREDAVRLALEGGSVAQQVAPLSNGSTFVVLCAGYEVEVTGTRFVVSYVDDVVGVDLSEGSLVVRDPDGNETALRAPARWRSAGGIDGEPEAPAVRDTAAPRVPPTPVTLADARLVRWSVDGTEVETEGPLSLGLAPGEHTVRGWDVRGRVYTATLPVGEAPVMLETDAMQPQAPRLRPGHLEPGQIRTVMARAMRPFRQCYERWSRNHSGVVRGRLRITVGVMGDVERVQIVGVDDGSLTSCIRNRATQLTFPPPGGPVTFEAPLTLAPSR